MASQIWIFPGRNDDAVPFGFFTTDHFEVHPRWQESGDPMFDYGAVFLDQPLGNQIGWFGYSALSDPALNRLLVNNAGYPADKPLGTLWYNAGRIDHVDQRMLVYGLDTEPGQSGSPIFYYDAQQNRIVVAIHAYGGCPENRGIRITPEVYQQITAWSNA